MMVITRHSPYRGGSGCTAAAPPACRP
jgi:hypothetical protein